MGEQRFAAIEKYEFANGAIGWRSGGSFDCLGPYAKVQNCPVKFISGGKSNETGIRLTCYATGYPDTYFTVPAVTRFRGQRITGYFCLDNDGGIVFCG